MTSTVPPMVRDKDGFERIKTRILERKCSHPDGRGDGDCDVVESGTIVPPALGGGDANWN